MGGEAGSISAEAFKQGLEVELEHGVGFPDANVTNNHPILTGRIVLAHLKETLDYYVRLDVAEIEGDMLKAYLRGDAEKLASKYGLLIAARAKLAEGEEEGMGKREVYLSGGDCFGWSLYCVLVRLCMVLGHSNTLHCRHQKRRN